MVISRVPPRPDGFVPRTSGALALLLVLAVVIGVWLLNGRDPGTGTDPGTSGGFTSEPTQTVPPTADATPSVASADLPETDPDSGLPVVALAVLPVEAADTVDLIDSDGPFPYDEDGSTFGNFEGILPDHERGYYAEYTVDTPGSGDRGARRIVAGDEGELYWTEDHYDSFERIAR
ncbi:ribonuclease domain-containing protein [Nocardioides sp.]|uniref:ribonuclease domain-containing protein n=1 Tax=Nocardioides sp. TaxID=35761 RepID=UPI002728059F|nr:ribonuclease domain-containing protein [Nocardioides sp.]MDO9454742.1 ribonuclease domain-containing protein [Nocardioides sp.]